MASKSNSGDPISGWVGWVGFGGFMLGLAGVFHIIAGLIALFKNTVYVIGEQNIWALDYTQWGWIHIIGGLLAIWAASSLLSGRMFGRIVAVLVASLSMVANMLFIPIYPIWSLMIITIDVLVIYAVIAHGGDLKE